MQRSKFPSINVNLKPCSCGLSERFVADPSAHRVINGTVCPGAPVLIPCPIPRSIHLMLTLGGCDCGESRARMVRAGPPDQHLNSCPARPVKVAATIGGETWGESEVEDVEFPDDLENDPGKGAELFALEAAARDRWALVKALLTNPGLRITGWEGSAALYAQRDAMFAALCKMARAEDAANTEQNHALAVLGHPSFIPENFIRTERHNRASASILERYVESLIERVGVLP